MYLETTKEIYKEAALNPNIGLCCTTTPIWQLPGLNIPKKMLEMNYGCGSTVHPRDLANNPRILYVGVGGGLELLQFAYFSRYKHAITGVDAVEEMLEASRENFAKAETLNPWFDAGFIDLLKGDALNLPIDDNSVDLAAQNCLFNIFKQEDLTKALKEMYRVLKPYGKLVMSDPICEQEMPVELRENEKLRALCLSGAIPLNDYVHLLTGIGFGTIEIRARRPYRILPSTKYNIEENIYVESIEVTAIKDPMPGDGPCVFTGRTAIYFGTQEYYDDGNGHVLLHNQPMAICDKTANDIENLNRDDIHVSPSTYFYDGGGCC